MFKSKNQKGFSLIEIIMSVAIISSIMATVTPIYIHNLTKAKMVADECLMKDAVNLANAMYVMEDEILGQRLDSFTKSNPLYYTQDATFSTSKFGVAPYGLSCENENSAVVVYYDNNSFNAQWKEIK